MVTARERFERARAAAAAVKKKDPGRFERMKIKSTVDIARAKKQQEEAKKAIKKREVEKRTEAIKKQLEVRERTPFLPSKVVQAKQVGISNPDIRKAQLEGSLLRGTGIVGFKDIQITSAPGIKDKAQVKPTALKKIKTQYEEAERFISGKLPPVKQFEQFIKRKESEAQAIIATTRIPEIERQRFTPEQIAAQRRRREQILEFEVGVYKSFKDKPLKAITTAATFVAVPPILKGIGTLAKAAGAGKKARTAARAIEVGTVGLYATQKGNLIMKAEDARELGYVVGDTFLGEIGSAVVGGAIGVKVVRSIPAGAFKLKTGLPKPKPKPIKVLKKEIIAEIPELGLVAKRTKVTPESKVIAAIFKTKTKRPTTKDQLAVTLKAIKQAIKKPDELGIVMKRDDIKIISSFLRNKLGTPKPYTTAERRVLSKILKGYQRTAEFKEIRIKVKRPTPEEVVIGTIMRNLKAKRTKPTDVQIIKRAIDKALKKPDELGIVVKRNDIKILKGILRTKLKPTSGYTSIESRIIKKVLTGYKKFLKRIVEKEIKIPEIGMTVRQQRKIFRILDKYRVALTFKDKGILTNVKKSLDAGKKPRLTTPEERVIRAVISKLDARIKRGKISKSEIADINTNIRELNLVLKKKVVIEKEPPKPILARDVGIIVKKFEATKPPVKPIKVEPLVKPMPKLKLIVKEKPIVKPKPKIIPVPTMRLSISSLINVGRIQNTFRKTIFKPPLITEIVGRISAEGIRVTPGVKKVIKSAIKEGVSEKEILKRARTAAKIRPLEIPIPVIPKLKVKPKPKPKVKRVVIKEYTPFQITRQIGGIEALF